MIENPVNIETHKAGHKIILREPKPFADFVELLIGEVNERMMDTER